MKAEILLFILFFPYCLCSTQFLTEYVQSPNSPQPLTCSVLIFVEQTTSTVWRYGFEVISQSGQLTVYVNGNVCRTSCSVRVYLGETTTVSYSHQDSNFMELKQLQDATEFYFENCEQDLKVCRIFKSYDFQFTACEDKALSTHAQPMDICTTYFPVETTTMQLSTVFESTTLEPPHTSEFFPTTEETGMETTMPSRITSETSLITEESTIFSSYSMDQTTFVSAISTEPSEITTSEFVYSEEPTSSGSTFDPSTQSSFATFPISPQTSTVIGQSTDFTTMATAKASTIECSDNSDGTTDLTTTMMPTTTTESPIEILKNISDSGVSLENVTDALSTTYSITKNAEALNSEEIYYVSNILTEAANLTDLPSYNALQILENVDNVLGAQQVAISQSDSQQRFLDVLPLMVSNCNNSTIEFLNGTNIGFASNRIGSNRPFNGIVDKENGFQTFSGSPENAKQNGIFVPESFVNGCDDCGGMKNFFFTIYRNRKFFETRKNYRPYQSFATAEEDGNGGGKYPNPCDRQTQLPDDTPVMSATIIDEENSMISRLSTQNAMAYTQFNVTSLLRPLHGNYKVTWWDLEAQDWATSDLCESKLKKGVVHSTCSHLTDFTLIIDSMVNDPNVCDHALTEVGLATNTVSIISLLFLIVIQMSTYIRILAATKLFQILLGTGRNSDAIQLFFNISLFGFYMVFTIFSNQKYAEGACDFMAALAYSLLLCSILLTIFQAQRTVIQFFPRIIRKCNAVVLQPIAAFSICLLVPFVISVILTFFSDFFKRNDGFCWVRPEYIIYATVIPVSFLILNAILCTSLIIWRMCEVRRKFSKHGRHHDGQLRTKILSILMLQITMGMPWIVQYFTLYHPQTTAWHYVFSIVIGSQGTMLALIYLYRRRKLYQTTTKSDVRRKLGVVQSSTYISEARLQNHVEISTA